MSELKVGVKVGYDGKELSSGIDNSRRKLSELAQSTQQNEMSAKAMAAALRGVPAQFTDIVTALQSGQRPLTVLLQQGGQLKDMFGGAVPAAKALGGYILGLINLLTITLTVATALGAAWYKGSQEADEFARALILTGNAAGTTVERLSQMRDAVAAATGATKGAAAEAITELASTGKVAESAMQGAAEAAVAMSRALGISVSDTVKEFNELGKSPVAAFRKLAEQYGYLNVEQLKQIETLAAIGKETEALQLAIEAHASKYTEMAASAQQNLGIVARAWLAVKDAVKATGDAIAGIGRAKTLDEQVAEAQKKLDAAREAAEKHPNRKIDLSEYERTLANLKLQKQEADQKAVNDAAEKKRNDAAVRFHDLESKAISKKITLEQELQKIRNTAIAAGIDPESAQVKRLADDTIQRSLGIKTKSSRAAELAEQKKLIVDFYADAEKAARKRGASESEINAIINNRVETVEALNKKFEEGAQKGGRAMRSALTASIDLASQLANVTQRAQSAHIRAAVALGEMSERQAIIEQAKAAEDKLNADILASRQKLAGASVQEAARLNARLAVLDAERLAAQQKLVDDLAVADQKAESERLTRQAEAAKRAGDMQTAYTLEWEAKNRVALKAAIASGNEELAQALEDGFKSGLARVKFDDLKRRYDALFADMTRRMEEVREEASRDGGLLAGFAADERVAQIRDEMIPQLQALIDKMREAGAEPLLTEKTVSESTRAIKKIINEGDKAWTKFTDDIERGLTDSLYRSFEQGKGFGQTFIESIKNLFKTTVLKLTIQSTVHEGLDMLGLGKSGGMGSLSNLFSLGKTAYDLYSGNSMIGRIAGMFGWGKSLGSGIGAGALGSGITGGIGGIGGSIGGGALGSGISGSIGSVGGSAGGLFGSLSGMSTLGWVGAGVGAAMAIFKKFKKKRGGKKYEGDAYALLDDAGGLTARPTPTTGGRDWLNGSMANASLQEMLAPVGKSIAELIHGLGGSARGIGLNIGFITDPKGKAQDQIIATLSGADGRQYYGQNRLAGHGSYETELQLEIQRMMVAAVRASDVAQVYKDIANSVDLARASAEQLSAVLNELSIVSTLRPALERVNLSADLASKTLVDAAGGLDALSSNLASYYEGYFSTAEKTARLGSDLNKQFAALGLTMPQTRAQFRALVESIGKTGAAGGQTLARLLSLSTVFGQWADAVNGATSSVASSMQQLIADAQRLQIELLRAQNLNAEADALQRKIDTAGMSADELAQYDANARLRAQVEAAQRLAQMQDAQADRMQALFDAQRARQQEALNAQVNSAKQVADTFTRLAESLKKYREGLLASDASPLDDGARYAEARRRYQTTVAKARLGDSEAVESLQEVVGTFLRASKTAHTSAADYRADFAEALASLDQVGAVAGRKGSIAQQQLQVAQAQLDALNAIKSSLAGSQTKLPTLVANPGRMAADWDHWFAHVKIGQTTQHPHGTATRVSQNRGVYTDTHGRQYIFNKDDNPYTLADKSEEWAEAIKRVYGVWRGVGTPRFASGGQHVGGWRIVGEQGPELEYTVPSRIYSNAQSKGLLDLSELLAAINALRADLRTGQAQSVHNTGKILTLLDRVSRGGNAVLTEAA